MSIEHGTRMITWSSIAELFLNSEHVKNQLENINKKLDKLLKKEPRIVPTRKQKDMISRASDIGGLES